MRIRSIRLKQFKRFHELLISDIPESARLVLLTGPNGSGKTSLFEAFNQWKLSQLGQSFHEADYFSRSKATQFLTAAHGEHINLEFHGTSPQGQNKKTFYIRSAYRNEPTFVSNALTLSDDILLDARRRGTLLNPELRVSDNYQRIIAHSVNALYADDHASQQKTAKEITDELIGEARKTVGQLFEGLHLDGPGHPMQGGTFQFTKGTQRNFPYKNLSGGEKAAFDLVLDFVVKRSSFDDTVFCIDEPELHMHTKLQSKLLEILFSLVPDNCQLWLSTHSIGIARKAMQLAHSKPGEVALIDFHGQDFDKQTELKPTLPNRRFWKEMFATALDDLGSLVMPEFAVFVESRAIDEPGKKASFDASLYAKIFPTSSQESSSCRSAVRKT